MKSVNVKFSFLLILPLVLILIPFQWLNSCHSICIYKNLTGHECYGCGMTRAVVSAMHLHFKEAYSYNKLIVIVLPVLAYVWVKNLIKYGIIMNGK
jgi:hypothetical protein